MKRYTEVAQLVAELLPRAELFVLMSSIEHRIQELPGMSSFTACTTWAANVQPLLAPQMRAQSEVATRM